VNEATGRGRQTTTASVLVRLSGGGAVVDTPGLREFALFNVPRRELTWLFRDLRAVAPRCRFSDCLHGEEPGCAVPAAVEAGEVAPWRFASYRRLVETAPDVDPWKIGR
jgi:ribosome biogenesis GTPase